MSNVVHVDFIVGRGRKDPNAALLKDLEIKNHARRMAGLEPLTFEELYPEAALGRNAAYWKSVASKVKRKRAEDNQRLARSVKK